ncbi:hypothetical protein LCGC14_0278630 [marine sediment metagenome]|uniref:Uncharacterized protein n=1 Tax=marine sediment metagenome TaxID=412755 RepID=A0A0F9TWX8_9ZZZZ
MKLAITLTWSKLIASVIFLAGLFISIYLLKKDQDLAVEVFFKSTTISAGLLGWRQAANVVKSAIPAKIINRLNEDRLSDEYPEVPVTDS